MMLAVCTVIYGVLTLVEGYPTGAPSSACVTMTPIHDQASAETSLSPFEVKSLTDSYGPNSTIIVFLSAPCGTERFGGFLLEARRADANLERNEPIGTFENVPESQYLGFCGNGRQAVTHKNTDPKAQLTFVWTAPEQTVGHIVFLATFAASKSSYWVKVASQVVRDQTNPLDPDLGGETYPSPTTCSVIPTPPPIPILSPDEECGVSKFCFTDCQDSSCSYIVSWKNSTEYPNGVHFEIVASTTRTKNMWLAIGFSEDREMGEDKVVECVNFNNTLKVHTSFNTATPGLENVRNENPHPDDAVHQGNLSFADGVFRCSFVVVTQEFSYINLNESYYLLLAGGKTATFRDTKLIHDVEQGKYPPVSQQKINFLGTYRNLTDPTVPSASAKHASGIITIFMSAFLYLLCV